MSNFLVRGIAPRVRRRLQELAEEENLSMNQYFLRLIEQEIARGETKEDEEKRRAEAFRRLDELREELHRKYGRFGDSAKLIREDRDTR